MKKIFRIKDEDGQEYKVEEIKTEKDVHDEDVDTLTSDEISGLKKLAANADKILSLLTTTDEEVKEEEEDDEIEDEDEETIEEKIESVIDTDKANGKACDSVKSIGAIEKHSNRSNDSVDIQDEIAIAWSKRYNGGNE